MGVIKISDLQSTISVAASDWIELHSNEAELIHGGWRHRHNSQIAVNKSIDALNSQIAAISSAANQGGYLFEIVIPAASDNARVSASIGSPKIDSGNFFYSGSGIAPIGAEPIPGFPGAYTF